MRLLFSGVEVNLHKYREDGIMYFSESIGEDVCIFSKMFHNNKH